MATTIEEALEHFEATEADITKLERLCSEIYALIPSGIQCMDDPAYDDKVRSAEDVFAHLPMIDGWKPMISFLSLNEIAQTRFDYFDYLELGEPMADIGFETSLNEPPRVDVLIIATSGRLSADAVTAIERQALSDRALKIEMWPESYLEMLLASRPALIAEVGLR